VSAPGAAPQIVHADTDLVVDADGLLGAAAAPPPPLLLTAFVALQPVTRAMGPTRFLPRTHVDAAAHAALAARGDATGLLCAAARGSGGDDGGGGGDDGGGGGGDAPAGGAAAAPAPSRVGLLDTGDATLYDGRLLHCGGANRSERRCVRSRDFLAPPLRGAALPVLIRGR